MCGLLQLWLITTMQTGVGQGTPTTQPEPTVASNTSEATQCGLTSTSVDFHALFGILVDLIESLSPGETALPHGSVKLYIERLQMFTPLPLDLLAGCHLHKHRRLRYCNRTAMARSERSEEVRITNWKSIYPSAWTDNRIQEEFSGFNCHSTPVKCKTDYFRFPPILCQAYCSPHMTCTSRSEHTVQIHYMEQVCDSDFATATWVLREKNLLKIHPGSCLCSSWTSCPSTSNYYRYVQTKLDALLDYTWYWNSLLQSYHWFHIIIYCVNSMFLSANLSCPLA